MYGSIRGDSYSGMLHQEEAKEKRRGRIGLGEISASELLAVGRRGGTFRELNRPRNRKKVSAEREEKHLRAISSNRGSGGRNSRRGTQKKLKSTRRGFCRSIGGGAIWGAKQLSERRL